MNLKKMKKYIKDFLKKYDLIEGDVVNCAKCGRSGKIENFDLHHKVFRSRGGTDDPENLEILCRDCHNKIHNG